MEPDVCYEALRARDARFDGVFFVGVTTTGIYCRPVCRVRMPGRDRCVFFARAAEAERDGYRACFRCRPELAPGHAPMDSVPRLVRAGVARIEAGALNEGSVDDLAAELGVTARHLRRAFETELGVSPIELAQSRRLALAKQLLQDTALPLAEVAFASGFQSVRRFNALFRAHFDRPPTEVRRAHGEGDASLTLRLDYRPPLDWDGLVAFFRARAVPGVEVVEGDEIRRGVVVGDRAGVVALRPAPGRPALRATVSASLGPALMRIVAGLRAMCDLDAHPQLVADALGRDPLLAPLAARRPGLRVPGAFDGFELALRAVLGQQVSVRAAATLAGRLAGRFGRAVTGPGIARALPTAAALARASEADVAAVGMPAARARAIVALARAVDDGLRLAPGADPDATMARLRELPGIGEWTAQYVAMRALAWPDAFPAGDLGVRRALGGMSEAQAEARAAAWRPWRAYAVLHLWQQGE
ncbi:MAG TPA: AlkA N-terminal domain-containing protein [Haliangiales bacterium]|nr:AlkA N-terminal domain-containing protein [Haliangiales bacterium]